MEKTGSWLSDDDQRRDSTFLKDAISEPFLFGSSRIEIATDPP